MKIIESPRDGLQGIKEFIPTEKKIEYLNLLLDIGFDTLDFGSFVSPKAIPQMRDTAEVVDRLDLSKTNTKLLSIVANVRGAEDASKFEQIKYLGFPFSISNTFLERNINSNISKSYDTALKIINIAEKNNKEVVIYFSMGFGNPYGDYWNIDFLEKYIEMFRYEGVKIISLSDTIGISTPEQIFDIFNYFIPKYTDIEFDFHLHIRKGEEYYKLQSAYYAGVRRFDTVIGGLGGCPAALSNGELISNLETTTFIDFCNNENIELDIDLSKLDIARDYMKKELLTNDI